MLGFNYRNCKLIAFHYVSKCHKGLKRITYIFTNVICGNVRKLIPSVIGFLLIRYAAESYQARTKLRVFMLQHSVSMY